MIFLLLKRRILHEDMGPFQLLFCSCFKIWGSLEVLWKSFFLGSEISLEIPAVQARYPFGEGM